jgi:nicotinate phosphoribosyltransferase
MTTNESEIARPVLVGDTADIYLHQTLTILRLESINPNVVMEFSPGQDCVFAGIGEVIPLLSRVLPETGREVWSLPEGSAVEAGEICLRIRGPYASFGLYETAVAGSLASGSGWATAARACVDAAQGIPVVSFGARHVHPSVSGIMDYSAVVGGCVSCSSLQGGRLAGLTPWGTMPHAFVLLIGDTVRATMSFDRHMPPEVPRVALVDTFKDEGEESLAVARALRERLRGVLLDTPAERGGVTPDLVYEVRERLNQGGFRHVDMYVSGGMTPERISEFVETESPVNVFVVGQYIAGASPIEITGDIKEINGSPAAKRGRIPGVTDNQRLVRVL